MELTLLQPRSQLLHKEIRTFSEFTDLIPLRKLIHRVIEICYPAYYDDDVIRFYKDLHHAENLLVRARNGHTIVCTQNNRIIGTGSLNQNYIQAMFTDPAFQGKGIGKRIMQLLLLEAFNKGLSLVTLEATPGSVGFYENFGFKTVREELFSIDPVTVFSYYIMEKTLL